MGWSNFTFMGGDGRVHEVDALVLSPVGFFLVEIKGHQGVVGGEQGWLTFRGEGRVKEIEHPRHGAAMKARALVGLLRETEVARRGGGIPFLQELVYLSHASGSTLQGPAAAAVVFSEELNRPGPVLPTIREALVEGKIPGGGLERRGRELLNREVRKRIQGALDSLGITRRRSEQRIGNYKLLEVLGEGPVFKDLLAELEGTPELRYRLRRFFVPSGDQIGRKQLREAIQREQRLLARLAHPSILQERGFVADEGGDSLVFEQPELCLRFDRYVQENHGRLSFEQRLRILRRIGEALQFAWSQGVVHRGLNPASVLILPKSSEQPELVQEVKLMNWSLGAQVRESGSRYETLISGTEHPEAFVDPRLALYLAPELRLDPGSKDPCLDVFSLGCLAYLLFTGKHPAETPEEQSSKLELGGFDLQAELPAAPGPLVELVRRSTAPRVLERYVSMAEFLEALSKVEAERSRSAITLPDPREARAGDPGPGGLRILKRLGSGATAVAFLVAEGPGEDAPRCVLKVAQSEAHNARIEAEGELLASLEHEHIARFQRALDWGAFRGFLTKPASSETLRARLVRLGPIQPELLERFGAQLLSALSYLEQRGINHRDLKPDNIAISDQDKKQALALVLFDFSLSAAPPSQKDVGTPAYIDPFVIDRRGWDLQAERYSAAVTLYEAATGTLPVWGDGRSDPRLTDAELDLRLGRFPEGYSLPLLQFFRRALARHVGDRFDNAEAMAVEWRKVFQTAQQPTPHQKSIAANGLAAAVEHLGLATPLHELGLGTRLLGAIDRAGLTAVGDFLRFPVHTLRQMSGVGAKTQEDLNRLLRDLRQLFPGVLPDVARSSDDAPSVDPGSTASKAASGNPIANSSEIRPAATGAAAQKTKASASAREPSPTSAEASATAPVQSATHGLASRASSARSGASGASGASDASTGPTSLPTDPNTPPQQSKLDAELARLLHPVGRSAERSVEILRRLLGLPADPSQPARAAAEAEAAAANAAIDWPTQLAVATSMGLNPGTVSQTLSQYRKRWAQDAEITNLRDLLAAALERQGGLLTPAECSEVLWRERGSDLALHSSRRPLAALARIAIEAEAEVFSQLPGELPAEQSTRQSLEGEAEGNAPRLALVRRSNLPWVVRDERLADLAARLLARGRKLAEIFGSAAEGLERHEVEADLLGQLGPFAGLLGTNPPNAPRLARLVASAATDLALSTRGELYPVGLPARRALERCQHLLTTLGRRLRGAAADSEPPGERQVDLADLIEAVQRRYPRAERLPARPALDQLLAEIGWPGRWDQTLNAGQGAYRLGSGERYSAKSASQSTLLGGPQEPQQAAPRQPLPQQGLPQQAQPRPAARHPDPTPASPNPRDPNPAQASMREAPSPYAGTRPPRPTEHAADFDRLLQETLERQGFLLLKVRQRHFPGLPERLAQRFPALQRLDLDQRLIAALDQVLAEMGIQATVFEQAEAEGPGGPKWFKVRQVADRAIERVAEELAGSATAGGRPLCLYHLGLLARFERWTPIEALNSLAGGSARRATLAIIPGDPSDPSFTVLGRAVPHLPTQALAIPDRWFESAAAPR
jgi:serine/threonine protein kinase